MMRSLGKEDDATGSSLGYRIRGSADLDFAIGNELIGRHRQVGGRGSLANAAGGVELRTMAGAEEDVVIALRRDRDRAGVGADANPEEPLIVALLDPRLIGLRIGETRDLHAAG